MLVNEGIIILVFEIALWHNLVSQIKKVSK